ncbi:MAG: hypothetical protein H8D97_01575 [Proteobacteria bacterium]|nr:hypothetical protein [Pseudomonadota bacterium]
METTVLENIGSLIEEVVRTYSKATGKIRKITDKQAKGAGRTGMKWSFKRGTFIAQSGKERANRKRGRVQAKRTLKTDSAGRQARSKATEQKTRSARRQLGLK